MTVRIYTVTVSMDIPPECPAYRIVELPRLADPHARDGERREAADPGRAQRVAALTAAYHAGIAGSGDGTVAFGWVRAAAITRTGPPAAVRTQPNATVPSPGPAIPA